METVVVLLFYLCLIFSMIYFLYRTKQLYFTVSFWRDEEIYISITYISSHGYGTSKNKRKKMTSFQLTVWTLGKGGVSSTRHYKMHDTHTRVQICLCIVWLEREKSAEIGNKTVVYCQVRVGNSSSFPCWFGGGHWVYFLSLVSLSRPPPPSPTGAAVKY